MTSLGEATVDIRATLDKLDGDLANARSRVQQAMASVTKIATAAAVGIGAAIGGAAVGAVALAASAEPLMGLEQGFASVMDRIGGSADEMLASLQDASGGLIANRDLMASFNKAASLVSDDFASQLPDAMSLVQRAAAATGEDMGFLFDSLVTGIGRVSPMILDNLGIQVSLAEATERAAEMFGVSADELSKQQQQAGLTAIVMERLNEVYGNVPDVESPFARAKVALANLRDEIGSRLLTAIGPLAEDLLNIAEQVLPKLFDVLDNDIMPVIEDVAAAFSTFFGSLASGEEPLGAISQLLEDLGLGGLVKPLEWLSGWFEEHGPGIRDAVEETFGKLSEVLGDLGGKIQEFVGEQMQEIADWLEENGPLLEDFTAAVGKGFAFIVEKLAGLWPTIENILGGLIELVLGIAKTIMQVATGDWAGAWETIKETASQVWEALKEAFNNFADWVAGWFGSSWAEVKQTWQDNWDMFKEIVSTVWDNIKTTVQEKLEAVKSAISGKVEAFKQLGRDLLEGLKSGILEKVGNIIEAVKGAVSAAIEAGKRALGIESPSKVFAEMGKNMMLGLARGVQATERFPDAAVSSVMYSLAGAAGAGAPAGGGAMAVTIPVYLDGRLVGRGVWRGTQEAMQQAGIRLEFK